MDAEVQGCGMSVHSSVSLAQTVGLDNSFCDGGLR